VVDGVEKGCSFSVVPAFRLKKKPILLSFFLSMYRRKPIKLKGGFNSLNGKRRLTGDKNNQLVQNVAVLPFQSSVDPSSVSSHRNLHNGNEKNFKLLYIVYVI
jgi:hypothetical protein